MEAPASIKDVSISQTPAGELHRFLKPLNFVRGSREVKVAVDGQIMEKTVDGQNRLFVCAQSGVAWKSRGVSFCDFVSEYFNDSHSYLKAWEHGCGVTVPNTALPADIGMVCDGEMELPLTDKEGETRNCLVGTHWSLFPRVDMEVDVFKAKFEEVKSSIACTPKGQADPQLFEIDLDNLPADRLSCVTVFALDELAETTDDGNTRMFAALYSGHIRAKDMDFSMVLEHLPMACMAGLALERFVIHDPELYADAYMAQRKLSKLLNDDDLQLDMPTLSRRS